MLYAAAIAGLIFAVAGTSQAITITGVSLAPTGSNTANFLNDTVTDYRENRSSVAVNDSGGTAPDVVANSVNAQTRYAAMVGADGGIATAPNRTATSNYTITFSVTASPGTIYNVSIDTSRIGAITRVDDGTGGASGNISALTGAYGVNAPASTAAFGLSAVTVALGTGASNTPFSQNSTTLTLTGLTGPNTINLSFNWTATANSTCTGSLCSSTGNDELAVRLGMAGTGSGVSADDYPGVGARNIATDGHFMNVTAVVTSVVPEPGTLALVAFGLAGIARVGRRRAA